MELYIDQNNKKQNLHGEPKALMINNLKVIYPSNNIPALDIDELKIKKGERLAIIGSSGAGKTTLMRTISGKIKPYSGEVRLTTYVRSIRGNVGFIYQNFNLIDRATVYENVLFGRLGKTSAIKSIFGRFSDTDREIAMDAIEEVNLPGKINQRTDTLSGGELQRVAIARVIAQEAEIILADEPVSNLDPGLAHEIMDLMTQISQRHCITLIVNLHQPALAKRYADRIIGLRMGRIVFDNKASQLTNSVLRDIYENEFNSSIMFEHKV